MKYTKEIFIEKAKLKHGNKYDYSLVEYKNSQTKVKIICSVHGYFQQRPDMHLLRNGCPKCKFDMLANLSRSNKNDFIKKAVKIHGNKYNYSLVEYKNTDTKVKIICSKHGEFLQSPHKHLMKRGCPKCKSSKGEIKIRNFLEENGIKYEEQKRFKECRDIKSLPFDFYLLEYNTLIEYDGELHFEKSRRRNGQEKLTKTILHDIIKDKFCENNNINLIRISYLEDIKEILNENIKRSK